MSTGIVRKIDDLGRVVIPAEFRRTLGIHEGDELEISLEGEQVVIKPRIPTLIHQFTVGQPGRVTISALRCRPGGRRVRRSADRRRR
jgi:AbrB family looped-hinge helix DNA binding protein